jgi:hypothetical protein
LTIPYRIIYYENSMSKEEKSSMDEAKINMNHDTLNHPHDCLTKEILSRKENARDFFFHYLPEHVRDLLDLDSLEICKDSSSGNWTSTFRSVYQIN